MKEWQLTDGQCRALASMFQPDWDVAAMERIRRAEVNSWGQVDVCFWYKGEPYRLNGKLYLGDDCRERSMEKYRTEKRARLAVEAARRDGEE